MTGGGCIWGYL